MSDNSDRSTGESKNDAKKQRLAQALRENLKKRKTQSRQRTASNANENNPKD